MINDGIGTIKAIGPARQKLFNKMGIFTVGDMLGFYPRAYEDRTSFKNICEVMDGETVLLKACAVTVVKNSRVRRGLSLQKVRVSDGSGIVEITWFNQDWIAKSFDLSADYYFYGEVKVKNHRLEMNNPVYEKVGYERFTNRIVPVYPLTLGLTQKVVQTTAEECLKYVGEAEETLPAFIREKYTLCGLDYALLNIHFPKDAQKLDYARRRLAFEELFYLQLAIRLLRQRRVELAGIKIKDENYSRDFIRSLPFELTDDQQKVIVEICADMQGKKPMNRLVQGDVGCGKTVVAAAAIYTVIKNGYQAAMMAPTEILADQHFRSLEPLLVKAGIRTVLLKGSMSAKQKREVYETIKSGGADLVVGTHAVIQKDVEFKHLALVVTDEQHRFGVKQRTALSEKGENPHTLVMTATPIPRTLALILYGDLDISSIHKLPPGRKPVDTYSVDESMRQRINNFMLKQIGEGRQVYIVCPMVDTSEISEQLKAVTDYADRLSKTVFKNHRVGVVHGRLPASEKEGIMQKFCLGEIDVLVSTTVIEVGVNVPNANTMVIENAERFGLSQLHQLRGRVGRGEYQSYCIMFCSSNEGVAGERMNIMTKTNDGFEISEKDLLLRGPGEFFGTRQHGLPEFKAANIYRDTDILADAGNAAQYVKENSENISKQDIEIMEKNLQRIYSDADILN